MTEMTREDETEAGYMDRTGVGQVEVRRDMESDPPHWRDPADVDAMRKLHAHNKTQPKGATIQCSACGKPTVKKHPAKTTCSRQCLDTFHNIAGSSKRTFYAAAIANEQRKRGYRW